MATKKRRSRKSRRHGDSKGRVIGQVHRTPGTFVWVTGTGSVREMHAPRRSSRHGNKRKSSRKGSRRSRR